MVRLVSMMESLMKTSRTSSRTKMICVHVKISVTMILSISVATVPVWLRIWRRRSVIPWRMI